MDEENVEVKLGDGELIIKGKKEEEKEERKKTTTFMSGTSARLSGPFGFHKGWTPTTRRSLQEGFAKSHVAQEGRGAEARKED
jgi:HSP20 family molecular chaperone IbpA